MKQKVNKEDTLIKLGQLSRGIFDSSSLIYLKKCGIMELALTHIHGIFIPEVIMETGFQSLSGRVWTASLKGDRTDEKIISLLKHLNLPLISEDKKLLKTAAALELPYYNALMILVFLSDKNILTPKETSATLKKLKDVARYSKKVYEYGLSLLTRI